MKESAVHPDNIQRYLKRWSAWWASAIRETNLIDNLRQWVTLAQTLKEPSGIIAIGLGALMKLEGPLNPSSPWPVA